MFKHAAYAAAAATALIAAPASAATVVTLTPGTNNPGPASVTLSPAFGDPLTSNGSFKFAVVDDDANNGAFSVTYSFTNPYAAGSDGTATATFSVNTGQQTITFTSADINGIAVTPEFGDGPLSGNTSVWNINLLAGTNYFTIQGVVDAPNGTGSTIVDGGLRINAIPEPATWALFILGFGAIGGAMRRRSSRVKVAKASLTFA